MVPRGKKRPSVTVKAKKSINGTALSSSATPMVQETTAGGREISPFNISSSDDSSSDERCSPVMTKESLEMLYTSLDKLYPPIPPKPTHDDHPLDCGCIYYSYPRLPTEEELDEINFSD